MDLASPSTKISSFSKSAMNTVVALAALRKDQTYANIVKPTLSKELSDAVNSDLGSNFKVYIDPEISYNAWVSPPKIDWNSPLWRKALMDSFRPFLQKDANKMIARSTDPLLNFFIDAKTGKWSGEMAKVPIEVHISWDFIYNNNPNITPAGAAGVLFHEYGHADSMMRSLGTTFRTDAILNQTIAAMTGNSEDTRVSLLTKIDKENKLGLAEDIEWLAKTNDPNVALVMVANAVMTEQRHEYGNPAYDARTFEALADAFAHKHGLAYDLHLAMAACPGAATAMRNTASRMAVNTLGTTILLMSTYFIGPITMLLPALLIMAYDPENTIYDNPAERVTRSLNLAITDLATRRGSVTQDDLDRIETLRGLADAYVKRPHWVQYLNEILTPTGRSNKNKRELQQNLQALISNDLYVTAAQLTNLAD